MFLVGKQTFFWLKPAGSLPYRTGSSPAACGGLNFVSKLGKAITGFRGYVAVNRPFIPNYGDRYRYGEAISTAFAESTVNQVISKRMVKKQQMRWTRRGAHLLLQVRTQTLNDDLRDTFYRWYPTMSRTNCSPPPPV
jgi:hypothetical protein